MIMTNRFRLMHLLVALLCMPVWTARAATSTENIRVLLVGVSSYPNLSESLQLSGPVNDVDSYYRMLRDRGIPASNIKLLADRSSIPGAVLPTKAAILTGFDQLESNLKAKPSPNNFVFILMAGHGSQMPAALDDRSETDGLDEIFLPRDVSNWDGEIGAVPNAISDNELGAAINRLRATGAFVWAVFDNCNSGSITRGGISPSEKNRSVTPAELGIPANALATAVRNHSALTRGSPAQESLIDTAAVSTGKGGVVAFYASQSFEVTPEDLLPKYSSDATQRGLFSFTLQQVLNVAPAEATYRQVAEDVLQRYRGMGRSKPTPSVEGTGLDAPVFGAAAIAAQRQWLVKKEGKGLVLEAGQLQEVTLGSVLALVPEASSEEGKIFGYVEVLEAGATQSRVQAVPYQGKPVFEKDLIGTTGVYARPVELKIDFSLRVSQPQSSAQCDAPSPSLLAAIQELKMASNIARRVQWIETDQAADIRLCAKKDQVFFLDPSANGTDVMTPAIALNAVKQTPIPGSLSQNAIALGSALERIGRATNLIRLVSKGTAANRSLEFDLNYERPCKAGTADCKPIVQPVNPLTVTSLKDDDIVTVTVKNTTFDQVDFSALYVDASFGISLIYPGAGESPRLEPAGTATFNVEINADPAGYEKLMFVAVPADAQAPVSSFDGLVQTGLVLTQMRGNTRSQNSLVTLLEEAAFGGISGSIRGAARPTQLVSPQVSFYEWSVSE